MTGTLWAQVARDLIDGIRSGRFPVGSQLPTELELCAHYGTSRHTVRTAIRQLQDQGLVSRNKKAGTRVDASIPTSAYRQSLASLEDLIQFSVETLRVVQDTAHVTTDGTLAAAIGCDAGQSWFRISTMRMDRTSGSQPISWTDVYIDPLYEELGEVARTSPDLIVATLIEQRYGRRCSEIRQFVDAIALPANRSVALQAQAETPALQIVRHYIDETGATFEISSTIHPAGRFTISQRLRRMKDDGASR